MTAGAFGQGRHRQCAARSKRTRERCRATAMNDKQVCYHHGGKSLGAKRNEAHPGYKIGEFSLETQEINRLAKASRKRLRVIGAIDSSGKYVPPAERPPEPPISREEAAKVLKTEISNWQSSERIRKRHGRQRRGKP